VAASSGATAISNTVFQFVASGINLFDSFGNLFICLYTPLRGVEVFENLALFSDLPVYKATYDLLLSIFRFTKDFSKEYKYTFGEIIKFEIIELITITYRSNGSTDTNETLTKGLP